MNDYKPDLHSWISKGARAFSSNWSAFVSFTLIWFVSFIVFFIPIFLLIGLGPEGMNFIPSKIAPILFLFTFVFMFVFLLLSSLYLISGLIGGAIQAVRGNSITLKDLHKSGVRSLGRLSLYTLLILLPYFISILAILLLISFLMLFFGPELNSSAFFPFLIFGIMILTYAVSAILWLLSFYGFGLVIERKAGVLEALKSSVKQTLRHFWWNLLFFIVCYAIYAMGALACYIGLIATLPLSICFYAAAYDDVFSIGTSAEEKIN